MLARLGGAGDSRAAVAAPVPWSSSAVRGLARARGAAGGRQAGPARGERGRGSRQREERAAGQQKSGKSHNPLSSACGVSCRAGAERACASRGFTAGLAPRELWVPRSAAFDGPRIRRAAIYTSARRLVITSPAARLAAAQTGAAATGPGNVRAANATRAPSRRARCCALAFALRVILAGCGGGTKLLRETTTDSVDGDGRRSRPRPRRRRRSSASRRWRPRTRPGSPAPTRPPTRPAWRWPSIRPPRRAPIRTAVALAPTDDWQAAIAASVLMASPIQRPDPAVRQRLAAAGDLDGADDARARPARARSAAPR